MEKTKRQKSKVCGLSSPDLKMPARASRQMVAKIPEKNKSLLAYLPCSQIWLDSFVISSQFGDYSKEEIS